MADAERAARETLFLAATLAALAVPPPFRGPAADSKLGEKFIDVIGLVAANGYAGDISHARYICGTTFRKGIPNPDGSLDRRGFLGGTADMIECSARLQVPWLLGAHTCPRQNDTTQLYRATAAGDEQTVRKLVAIDVPLNGKSCYGGWSALHSAAFSGYARIVKILLDGLYGLGAEVDRREANHMRRTALIIACEQGRKSVVRELLAHGASVSAQDSTGSCALHTAVLWGDDSILTLLCAAPGAANAMTLIARDEAERLTPLGFARRIIAREAPLGSASRIIEREACAKVLSDAGAV